ncbi:hypothetical protein [Microcoleus sp. bin38.metabat.b11b12b14.051]|uniref:hypothetical protein n=1 Tax=Microcoleus sp. bin38.metabat.b11b12b14.051 TaxID=2742709 RepID=UPI0025F85C7F|nr:hypothetical protein [Microcoleus sp. bin38.metabat.b11b12b14.051]
MRRISEPDRLGEILQPLTQPLHYSLHNSCKLRRFFAEGGCGEIALRCQKQEQPCDILSYWYPLWRMVFSGRAIGQIYWLLKKPGQPPVSRTETDA